MRYATGPTWLCRYFASQLTWLLGCAISLLLRLRYAIASHRIYRSHRIPRLATSRYVMDFTLRKCNVALCCHVSLQIATIHHIAAFLIHPAAIAFAHNVQYVIGSHLFPMQSLLSISFNLIRWSWQSTMVLLGFRKVGPSSRCCGGTPWYRKIIGLVLP